MLSRIQATLARMDARAKRPKRATPKPRKAKRKFSGPYRRAHSPRPPHAVELFFIAALQRMASRFAKSVWAVVEPRIKDFANPAWVDDAHADAMRLDGPNDKAANTLLKGMKSAAKGSLHEKEVGDSAAEAGVRTLKHSQREFKRLAIDVRKEPNLTPLMDGWRKDTVARITNMHAEQLDKVDKVLREGFGRHVESMAKDIQRQLVDVSASRAELIARDQILTLNAKITRHRQKAAGIDSYEWTTSGDERVREEHDALDGQTFSWDGEGDPEEGHPGEAVNCRCTAFPVLGELDDEDEDE